MVVHEDYGGQIADVSARVSQYLKRRVSVRIEGDCISTCTLVTALPAARLCVGANGSLQLNQSFLMNRFGPLDTSNRSEEGTATMMRFYRSGCATGSPARAG